MQQKTIAFLLLIVLVLVACDTGVETEQAPSIDPLRVRQQNAETQAFQTRQVPTITMAAYETEVAGIYATRTASVIIPTVEPPPNVITRAPTVPVLVMEPDSALGNAMIDQSWLAETFTTIEGTVYTLADFADSIVLIQTVDLMCDECVWELQTLREVAEDFRQIEAPYTVNFLILNLDIEASSRALGNWAERHELGPETNWIVGTVSRGLRQVMIDKFGEIAVTPEDMAFIVIDRDGIAHINRRGSRSKNEIRNVLIYYAEGAAAEEEVVPEE